MPYAADAPSPGATLADAPMSRWVSDAPQGTVETIAAEHIPAIPSGIVANFTGLGVAAVVVVAKPGIYALFVGEGGLTAAVRVKVAVTAMFTGGGQFGAVASIPARFTGSGTWAVYARAGATRTAAFTGSGTLSATIDIRGLASANFTGQGVTNGAVAIPLAAGFTGIGALSAAVIGGYPVTAAFTGSGALSAAVIARPVLTANFTGSGALSVQLATFAVAAAFTGSGTLSAVVDVSFQPSGMTKNGTQSWATSATWIAITSWTANTGTYPGSSVSSDRLVVQGSKTNATVSAAAPYTGGQFLRGHAIRLVDQSGTVIGTAGSTVSADSGTCTVTATGVNLTGITSIGVQMQSSGSSPGTITSGSTCNATIT